MKYLESVKKEIEELKDLLELNKEAIKERCRILESTTKSLMALTSGPEESLKALYQLPKILGSILSNDSIGAIILGGECQVLLFNGVAQKIFGEVLFLDELKTFNCPLFRDEATLCAEDQVPWKKAYLGQETNSERFFIPRSERRNGAWLSIDAVPLFGESKNEVSGVVLLVVDITEPIQLETRVRSIVSALAQHILTIETAQTELKVLSEKLVPARPSGSLIPPEPVSKRGSDVVGLDVKSALASDFPFSGGTIGAGEIKSDLQAANRAKIEKRGAGVKGQFLIRRTLSGDTDRTVTAKVRKEAGLLNLRSTDGQLGGTPVSQQLSGVHDLNAAPSSDKASIPGKQSQGLSPDFVVLESSPHGYSLDQVPPQAPDSWTESGVFRAVIEPRLHLQKPILVVDDLTVNQYLLQMQLEKDGFSVHTAMNGQEAVEKVLDTDYLCVFMDCDMPVMNGYEATTRIRQMEEGAGKHTPVIAMTAYDRHGDRERCNSVGMDFYLTKGVTPEEIDDIVQLCLKGDLSALEELSKVEKLAPPTIPFSEEEERPRLNVDSLVRKYGQETTTEIVGLFLRTSTNLLTLLNQAIDDRDSPAVNHLCYSLKGPCASLALGGFVKQVLDVATYAALGKWQEAKTSFDRLKDGFEHITQAVAPAKDNQSQARFEFNKQKLFEALDKFKSKVDEAGVRRLIEAYNHDLTGAEEQVKKAIQEKDSEKLRATSHRLAGALRSLSAKEAEVLCKEMEGLAVRCSWQKAAEKFVPMFTSIRDVSRALSLYEEQVLAE